MGVDTGTLGADEETEPSVLRELISERNGSPPGGLGELSLFGSGARTLGAPALGNGGAEGVGGAAFGSEGAGGASFGNEGADGAGAPDFGTDGGKDGGSDGGTDLGNEGADGAGAADDAGAAFRAASEAEAGTVSTTYDSLLLELISAKKGRPPAIGLAGAAFGAELFADGGAAAGGGGGGGAWEFPEGSGGGGGGRPLGAEGGGVGGGAVFAEGVLLCEADAPGKGGGAPGTGGGALGSGGAELLAGCSSNEPMELTLLFFKWLDFFGREGGILGGALLVSAPGAGGGGAWLGKGGGAEGTGGLGAAVFPGLCDGLDGAEGIDSAFCAAEGGTPIPGISGAEDGTMPSLLSVLDTDLSLGIPPANISPNCGTPDRGIDGADVPDDAALLGAPLDTLGDELESINGFDLSTVTAFFNCVPFLISPNKALRPGVTAGGGGGPEEPPPRFIGGAGGGGGGGGGGPAMISGVENRALATTVWCVGVLSGRLVYIYSTSYLTPQDKLS